MKSSAPKYDFTIRIWIRTFRAHQDPRPAMFLQNPFHNSVPLIKIVASDHAFVPDENIFSGLDRFSGKGILNTSLHVMEFEGSVGK
jgi:hypothetical protein